MNAAQSAIGNLDLDKLSDGDKAELRQFLGNQQQRAQIQTRSFSTPPYFAASRMILYWKERKTEKKRKNRS